VAVNGKVYDVSASKLWKNGAHMGQHYAGGDLTAALGRAPHSVEMLERYQVVGELEAENAPQPDGALAATDSATSTAPTSPAAEHTVPWWANLLVSMKSHPITVHFPQALFVFAPIFLTLAYALEFKDFERTAFFLMVAAFLTSIPATVTGFVHWWFKYGSQSRLVFKLKIVLSLLLVILAAVTAGVHYGKGGLTGLPVDEPSSGLLILYWVQFLIAMVLGKAGGNIVFGKSK
jgi:predicted heme/steroid binding protein/uncharacterized membrane protein